MTRQKFNLSALLLLAFTLLSCSDQLQQLESEQSTETQPLSSDVIDGVIDIKFTANALEQIDPEALVLSPPTGSTQIDSYMRQVGASQMRRIFPHSGKFEQRQVNEGLNLWYRLTISEQTSTRSATLAADSEIVEFCEPVLRPRLSRYEIHRVDPSRVSTRAVSGQFNDPLFHKQWNLHNDGTVGAYEQDGESYVSSISGADVNIIPAWQQSTGDESVIVSVIDGGIDVDHVDLVRNVWVNSDEIPANGIDDDNNGYIDDVNGFNFVDWTGVIEAEEHGTHVAGVISASNNNGIGISSIAGGDATKGGGVKVMSCQIFRDNPDYDPDNIFSSETLTTNDDETAAAIVYGANNGAVISQNSWGYNRNVATPRIIADAIDYFQKYAGIDPESSMQSSESLIAGGVVIFAAGNDETSAPTYPANEDGVISVGAFAPDFAASWYTNYGDWVTISAPGGWLSRYGRYGPEDGEYTSGVLSTLRDDGYGYMQGTSMACPHVSAIAALIISKYGGMGYDTDQLRQRLLTAIKPLNYNNFVDGAYRDNMGVGYIDASVALTEYDYSITPADPIFFEDESYVGYESIDLVFGVNPTQDRSTINHFKLFLSEEPITLSNINDINTLTRESILRFDDNSTSSKVTFDELKQGQKYYAAIVSVASNGNQSELLTYSKELTTKVNQAPRIIADEGTQNSYTLEGNKTISMSFTIEDPENHNWYYSVNLENLLEIESSENRLFISFNREGFIFGDYEFNLTVEDEFGARDTFSFDVTVVNNLPPSLVRASYTLDVKSYSTTSIPLREVFTDESIGSVTYEIISASSDIFSATIKDQILTLVSSQAGQGTISLRATDEHEQTTEVELPVNVYINEGIYLIHPSPVQSVLNINLGNSVNGAIELVIRDRVGRKAMSKALSTNQLPLNDRRIELHVEDLFPGLYTLELIQGTTNYSAEFIKM